MAWLPIAPTPEVWSPQTGAASPWTPTASAGETWQATGANPETWNGALYGEDGPLLFPDERGANRTLSVTRA